VIALSNEKKKKIEKFAIKVREDILFTAFSAGANSSHFGGSLSTVEIISVLYANIMNYNKNNFLEDSRDRFILSKGHGCLAYYSALHQIGLIEKNELANFEKSEGYLFGHPIQNRNIGIEFSNGSLGMGLSLGIGVSIALIKKKLINSVYTLLGDGECNEGSVWEAAMSAPNFNLKNLCVIIDNNGFQQTGSNIEIMNSFNLAKKWKSFGWNVIEIDGHNIDEIYEALKKDFGNSYPKVLIAKTIKGKGFKFSENNNNWHHAVLTQKQYDEAIKELNENIR
jgi:transketolase|tara:strand:+ start:6532 stop:7374 length:843 start_codon:yes stop_codon:yes gene_type:complete